MSWTASLSLSRSRGLFPVAMAPALPAPLAAPGADHRPGRSTAPPEQRCPSRRESARYWYEVGGKRLAAGVGEHGPAMSRATEVATGARLCRWMKSGSRERRGLELDEPVIDAPGRLLGFVNSFLGLGLPPATRRTPPWVWQPQRRTPVGGWRETQLSQGVVQRVKPDGGWRKTQFGQGEGARQAAECRKGVCGTQSGNWPRCQRSARWKLRCNGKRTVCCCQPTGAC